MPPRFSAQKRQRVQAAQRQRAQRQAHQQLQWQGLGPEIMEAVHAVCHCCREIAQDAGDAIQSLADLALGKPWRDVLEGCCMASRTIMQDVWQGALVR